MKLVWFSIFYLWLVNVALGLTPSDGYQWTLQQSNAENFEAFHDYGEMSIDFQQQVSTWVSQHLAKSTRSTLTTHQKSKCIEGALFQSMDPEKIAPQASTVEKRFVESLFIIESSYCLPNTKLDKAFSVFMSEDFRIDVMPQVTAFSMNSSQNCVTSSGITGLLLPSYYCSDHSIQRDENHILIYNTLAKVTNDSEHQPLYLRDEIIVLSQVGSDTAFYRATFSRSQDLGTTTKYLLRNTVSSSQSNIRDGYYEWVKK